MARHRSTFDKQNPLPYELSRSKIENFVRCKACFHLQQVEGIKFPNIPGFNINEATDVLLKRDFDKYRALSEPHPYLVNQGLGHLVPFQHPDFELWTQSLHFGAEGRMNTVHQASNIKLGGGLDDVWLNKETNQLHIVDYKSTSSKKEDVEINLEGQWKQGYKRQMDMYVWIMRRMGFDVSSVGYFLYCDGDRFSDYAFLGDHEASMIFKMTLIPYEVTTDWIEPILMEIKECLLTAETPDHSDGCEYGLLLAHFQ